MGVDLSSDQWMAAARVVCMHVLFSNGGEFYIKNPNRQFALRTAKQMRNP